MHEFPRTALPLAGEGREGASGRTAGPEADLDVITNRSGVAETIAGAVDAASKSPLPTLPRKRRGIAYA